MLTREENVAKYGGSNAKEAMGLALVREALETDGRLCFHRSAEGARADFVVHLPGEEDRALGVQLKTCHTLQHPSAARHGHAWMGFSKTGGYAGLLILLISFTYDPPRAWLVAGQEIGDRGNITIGTHHSYMWQRREAPLHKLPHRLLNAIQMGPLAALELQPVETLIRPSSATRSREFEAFCWLRERFPLLMHQPEVEHQAFDYLVDGAKWQLKLANYVPLKDRFHIGLSKLAGMCEGKSTTRTYDASDFDWLAVHLPSEHEKVVALQAPRFYLIPMRTLVAHQLVGKAGVTGTALYLYPHRCTHTKRNVNAWVETYMVDLTSHASARADYERIRRLEETQAGK